MHHGEGLWTWLETENCFVPNDLRRVLTAAKYDNLHLLAKIKEEDYKTLTKFMSEDLHMFIEEHELRLHNGVFKKTPSKFKFMPGELKILAHMSESCKRLINANASKRSSSDSGTPSQKRVKSTTLDQISTPTPADQVNKLIAEKIDSLTKHINSYIDSTLLNLGSCALNFEEVTKDADAYSNKVTCPASIAR